MFAIIKTGGKQYRVAAQDVITVDRLAGNPGEAVRFGEVLLVGGESVVVGNPTVAGATVAGQLVEQSRGDKVIAFKKRRRKNSRRKRGHRQEHSVVRITEILTEGRSPSAAASEPAPVAAQETGAEPEAAAAPAREEPATEPAE
jgi:large subunit ribosomal protein L21